MMQRRTFLKVLLTAIACQSVPGAALAGNGVLPLPPRRINRGNAILQATARKNDFLVNGQGHLVLNPADVALLKSATRRLARLQLAAGHGNFSLMNLEEARERAGHDPKIGAFSDAENRFMHRIFQQDAKSYGFMGPKPLKAITDDVKGAEIVRVPGTGNYLFAGTSVETFHKMSRDVGSELILTSGIRGITKQFYLFFRKAVKTQGNLSLASWSLAPPGYSFHGIGDFDVGSVGLGSDNFTRQFTRTDVFRKLRELDYVRLRYAESNTLGVRYEPWHIKVT